MIESELRDSTFKRDKTIESPLSNESLSYMARGGARFLP